MTQTHSTSAADDGRSANAADVASKCPTPPVVEEPIVEFKDVSKSFGSLRVLHHVNLAFRKGDCTVVLGPSGTGKSVLLKHIVGLLRPDQGEVYFDGQRVDTMSEKNLVDIRRHIGFLFQMGALFDSMNVGMNIECPLI